MSAFPGSPRLVRGGIVLLDPTTSTVLRVITLQYSPDSISHILTAHITGDEPGNPQAGVVHHE
jgi:hypothetical protein